MTSAEAIERFEPVATPRPVEPPRSGTYLLPMLLGVAGYVVGGLVGGGTGWLWGLVGGAAVAGALWMAELTRRWTDVGLVAAASVIGVQVYDTVVAGRTGEITIGLSLRAATGWLLVGAVIGYVVWRSSARLTVAALPIVSLAFFSGGVLALQWGTGIGYVQRLRASQVEAGLIPEITGAFPLWAGFIAAAIGIGVVFSLRVGTPILAAIGTAAALTVFAYAQVQFSITEIVAQLTSFAELEEQFDFWPPQWSWPPVLGAEPALAWVDPFIETLQIAVVGATLGCTVALPLAFLASRPTSPNGAVYWTSKGFMNVLRTMPDLFWATLFVAAVGAGRPFPGALAMVMFSLTIMAKLLSETVDSIDPGPLEAGRATGSTHSEVIRHAALPQVLPNYVAYALYIFELNIRASVVIGFVGAGGIGQLLNEQRNLFQWDRVLAIVIVIFISVLVIEFISITARRRLV